MSMSTRSGNFKTPTSRPWRTLKKCVQLPLLINLVNLASRWRNRKKTPKSGWRLPLRQFWSMSYKSHLQRLLQARQMRRLTTSSLLPSWDCPTGCQLLILLCRLKLWEHSIRELENLSEWILSIVPGETEHYGSYAMPLMLQAVSILIPPAPQESNPEDKCRGQS